MQRKAGAGVLVSSGREFQVTYDLVESRAGEDQAVRGQVFGNPEELAAAYRSGPASLRLDNGKTARLVLLDCDTHGAADVRLIGKLPSD